MLCSVLNYLLLFLTTASVLFISSSHFLVNWKSIDWRAWKAGEGALQALWWHQEFSLCCQSSDDVRICWARTPKSACSISNLPQPHSRPEEIDQACREGWITNTRMHCSCASRFRTRRSSQRKGTEGVRRGGLGWSRQELKQIPMMSSHWRTE